MRNAAQLPEFKVLCSGRMRKRVGEKVRRRERKREKLKWGTRQGRREDKCMWMRRNQLGESWERNRGRGTFFAERGAQEGTGTGKLGKRAECEEREGDDREEAITECWETHRAS